MAVVTGAGAHGGAADKVHSCIKDNGKIRIVGASEQCDKNEEALDWSQSGAPGPQGRAGPGGPAGPQGPAGRAGGGFADSALGSTNSPAACTTSEQASLPVTLSEPSRLFASGQGELRQSSGSGGVSGVLV